MFSILKLFIIIGIVAAVFGEKTSTTKPLLETASPHTTHKTTAKPHHDAKVEQILQPPPSPAKETDQKDLKSENSFGIGYYGYPIAYGGYYPYYPYYPYYRQHYGYGYPFRPHYGYRPLPVFGVSIYG